MFVTKKHLQAHIEYLERDIKAISDRYWDLHHKHLRLLEHFGLSETRVPETIELRKKGGPEPGR